jgi:hypothetical protein
LEKSPVGSRLRNVNSVEARAWHLSPSCNTVARNRRARIVAEPERLVCDTIA